MEPNKLCPNGHDTRNEIGNCYTCGEPFDAPEPEPKHEKEPAPKRSHHKKDD